MDILSRVKRLLKLTAFTGAGALAALAAACGGSTNRPIDTGPRDQAPRVDQRPLDQGSVDTHRPDAGPADRGPADGKGADAKPIDKGKGWDIPLE